jgi:hypothetical protein
MLAEKRIEIVEVGPRDGLQSEPGILPTATKVEFIERAIAAGVRRVEVTSFVNPKRVPQMADAEAVLQALPRREGVHYIGLVLNRKGFERAAAAGCNEIGMAVVASDTFNQRNQGVTTEASIAAWLDIAAAAKAAGIRPQVTISAAFGCPFEGEVPAARVVEIARRVAEVAPFEVAHPCPPMGDALKQHVEDGIFRLDGADLENGVVCVDGLTDCARARWAAMGRMVLVFVGGCQATNASLLRLRLHSY